MESVIPPALILLGLVTLVGGLLRDLLPAILIGLGVSLWGLYIARSEIRKSDRTHSKAEEWGSHGDTTTTRTKDQHTTPLKTVLEWLAGIVAVVWIFGAFHNVQTPSASVSDSTSSMSATDQENPGAPSSSSDQSGTSHPAAVVPRAAMPPREQRFVTIIQKHADQFDQASNGMQKGAVRTARRKALCGAFHSLHINKWVGVVTTLDSTSSGRGVLAVNLSPDITLATANNDFSDSLMHDTIPPGSPLFKTVSAMKAGEQVVFSGDFAHSDNDCFEELSLTRAGGMEQPSFSFRFTQVEVSAAPK